MRNVLLAVVALACLPMLAPSQAAPETAEKPASVTSKKAAQVTFVFKTTVSKQEGMDFPRTIISLKVGAKVYKLKTVTGEANLVDNISAWRPEAKGALTACTSWYAGQGDEFFVKKSGRTYLVYHRGVDSEAETGKFKIIKRIRA
jgi:hypothetical protein